MNDDEYLLEETTKLSFASITMLFCMVMTFIIMDLVISFNIIYLIQGGVFIALYTYFLIFKFNIQVKKIKD